MLTVFGKPLRYVHLHRLLCVAFGLAPRGSFRKSFAYQHCKGGQIVHLCKAKDRCVLVYARLVCTDVSNDLSESAADALAHVHAHFRAICVHSSQWQFSILV